MKNKKLIKLLVEIKENEIIKDISLFYSKNKKICKTIFVFLLLYIFLIIYLLYNTILKIDYLYNRININYYSTNIFLQELSSIKMEESIKLNNINLYDLKSDNSLQTFVTSNISFNDKAYIPENLVNIRGSYIYDSKGGTQKLRKEAKDGLDLLSKAFYEKFSRKIEIVSAYRSYEYQVGIKAGGCPDNLCAKAGFSEHQTGLAFDIFQASSNNEWKNSKTLMSYYNWLDENAHLYGFHNTYQKGLNIDGYEIEPWHWRYLGVELSTYLHENNLTFAEFYKQKNN